MATPTRREIVYRIGLETMLGARTVGDFLDGKPVRPATRAAIVGAARRLGLELPGSEQVKPEQAHQPAPVKHRPAPSTSTRHERADGAPKPAVKRNRQGKGSAARSAAKWAARQASREQAHQPEQSAGKAAA